MMIENMIAKTPTLFRTYEFLETQTPHCTIWEAARATTAAPNCFEDISIGTGSAVRYIEPGIGSNNPITQVCQEAKLIFPGRHIAAIISIGCGQASTISTPKQSSPERLD